MEQSRLDAVQRDSKPMSATHMRNRVSIKENLSFPVSPTSHEHNTKAYTRNHSQTQLFSYNNSPAHSKQSTVNPHLHSQTSLIATMCEIVETECDSCGKVRTSESAPCKSGMDSGNICRKTGKKARRQVYEGGICDTCVRRMGSKIAWEQTELNRRVDRTCGWKF